MKIDAEEVPQILIFPLDKNTGFEMSRAHSLEEEYHLCVRIHLRAKLLEEEYHLCVRIHLRAQLLEEEYHLCVRIHLRA